MNSDPNNNVNGQVPNTTTSVQTTPTPTTEVIPTATITPIATTPTTQATPVAPTVSSEGQTAPSVTPVTQPTQQRVQLVDDKVSLKAIAPTDMVQKSEKEKEKTEVLEPVSDAQVDSTETTESKSGGCFQNLFLFIVFGGLLVFILKIDAVTAYVQARKESKNQIVEEITTGTLVCESEKSSNDMDYTYTAKFGFRNSKLKRLNYLTEIRGDANIDDAMLTELNNKCLLVKEHASNLNGVDITCSFENGLLKEKQAFTYDLVNRDEAMSAFVEAGGIYPDYKSDQNIDEIEKEMNAAAYTCKRIK